MAEAGTAINELMDFLQENMATKQDLLELEERVEKKIDGVSMKIDTAASSLSSQINSIEIELKDIKQRLERLEKHTIEDADAAASDILALQKRAEISEQKVRDLQPA